MKGLSLPTGPSYDPADEEDLRREEAYQRQMRERMKEDERRVQDIQVREQGSEGGDREGGIERVMEG